MTNALKDSLIYCGEEDITRQVIVQRRGKEPKPGAKAT